jgi:transposase
MPAMVDGELENGTGSVWAVGIARGAGGVLQAVMRQADGVEVLEPLDALHTRGLPEQLPAKRPIETSFDSWRKADFDEFGQAFGAPVGGVRHDVWSFEARGLTFIVPALALMRAVFRPQLKMLPRLFQPQGLDEICSVADGQVAFNLRADSTNNLHTLASVVEPYQWMQSFPSARRMAASVYAHACSGTLSLDLPLARARLTLHGVVDAKRFLVTKLNLITVAPEEAPLQHAADQGTRLFSFISTERVGPPDAGSTRSTVRGAELLPLRAGASSVSDAEWTLIEPTLGPVLGRRQVHDRREMLNGILEKLCSGRPWRDVDYTVGTFVNASRQYATWRSTGKWDAVLEVLSARQAMPAAELRVPMSSGRTELVAALGSLSEGEWSELLLACPKPLGHRTYDYRTTVVEVLRHELTGEAWFVDKHAGKGFEHTAARLHRRWRKSGVIARIVYALGAIVAGQNKAKA